MNKETWTQVDGYLASRLMTDDPVLAAALAANKAADLPAIDVSPLQGKFLHLLASLQGARRLLEIGTLGGYSTIWLARALPKDGVLVTLEAEERHAQVAKANLTRAGFDKNVQIRVGKALETLPQLADESKEPFDFVFIDADKENTAAYFSWAVKLTRPGSVIVVDNVVRTGEVANLQTEDPRVQGMQRFIEAVKKEPRVSATGLQTVGMKGYDGFVIMRVIS